MDMSRLKGLLYAAADAATFVLTKPLGLAALGAFLLLGLILRLSASLKDRSLACEAAGRRLGAGQSFLLILKEVYTGLASVAAQLPTVAIVLVGAVLLVGVADSVRKIDAISADRARISELSAVVRNLERRYRVADVRVLAADGKTARISLAFYGTLDPGKPERTQDVTIQGTELYVDALVLDFAYSEIEAGRRVNLVLPYRVFGDRETAADGAELALRDEEGVPLLYRRSESEIYGMDPARYDERLEELMDILSDEGERRRAGIVRSVFGAAIRRRIQAGDAFTIWSEQTGGLTVKGESGF